MPSHLFFIPSLSLSLSLACPQTLFQLLTLGGLPVRYYLETIVFPETTSHQQSKLSANGQDLGGGMLFGTRIGFSGTPSSLLPLELGECVYQQVAAPRISPHA